MKVFLSFSLKISVPSINALAKNLAVILSLFSILSLFPHEGWSQQEHDFYLEGDMVYIPPGPFLFGTNKNATKKEI